MPPSIRRPMHRLYQTSHSSSGIQSVADGHPCVERCCLIYRIHGSRLGARVQDTRLYSGLAGIEMVEEPVSVVAYCVSLLWLPLSWLVDVSRNTYLAWRPSWLLADHGSWCYASDIADSMRRPHGPCHPRALSGLTARAPRSSSTDTRLLCNGGMSLAPCTGSGTGHAPRCECSVAIPIVDTLNYANPNSVP